MHRHLRVRRERIRALDWAIPNPRADGVRVRSAESSASPPTSASMHGFAACGFIHSLESIFPTSQSRRSLRVLEILGTEPCLAGWCESNASADYCGWQAESRGLSTLAGRWPVGRFLAGPLDGLLRLDTCFDVLAVTIDWRFSTRREFVINLAALARRIVPGGRLLLATHSNAADRSVENLVAGNRGQLRVESRSAIGDHLHWTFRRAQKKTELSPSVRMPQPSEKKSAA